MVSRPIQWSTLIRFVNPIPTIREPEMNLRNHHLIKAFEISIGNQAITNLEGV